MRFIPRKSLGQSKLFSKKILERISEASKITKEDTVLEVGAGSGNLTEVLSNNSKKIIAIEIDKRFLEKLIMIKKKCPNVDVIIGDFFSSFVLDRFHKLTIVSNIPFYITTKFIEYLCVKREHLKSVNITVQKEIAEKLLSKPGEKKFYALTVITRTFFDIEKRFDIPNWYFSPKPKVMTSFITLYPKTVDLTERESLGYIDFVHRLFSKRRKKLSNILPRICEKIDFNRRPDTLSFNEFFYIFKKIKESGIKIF